MKVSPLINKVILFIKSNNLLVRGDICLLAVSGGWDSVVLLDIFSKIKNLFDIEYAVAHVNYNLRGQYSIDEENYVKSLAEKYQVKFHGISLDLNTILETNKESLENKARKIRYDFFKKTADENNYSKVVLAHNSNDQAETILLKLIRGSVSGLKGIEVSRKLAQDSKIDVIRPILSLSRKEIELYADKNNLQPKTDLSNLENAYKRNRVRHNILPQLIEENPNFLEVAQQMSNVISEEDKYLDSIAFDEYKKTLINKSEREIILSSDKIKMYPDFLQRRIFKLAFQDLSNTFNSFSYKNLEAIREVIDNNQSNKIIELPKGFYFCKDKNYLIFSKVKPDFKINNFTYHLENKVYINETKTDLILEKINYQEINYQKNNTFFKKNENEILDIKITNYSPQLNFIPYGKNSSVKLKDFLDKRKIPETERKNLNIVFINHEILWISGITRSNIRLITPEDKNIYKILALFR